MKMIDNSKRMKLNQNRKLREAPQHAADRTLLEDLAGRVRYGGNPEHKKNPGDFGLTPPAQARPHKTLCDAVHIVSRTEAEALLKEGLRKGLISEQMNNEWPKHVWAVTNAGRPVEAVRESGDGGVYHGYPMQSHDPLCQRVLERWQR